MKLVITAVLYAISFIWVIPALGIGVTTHGGFGTALGLAFAFTVVSWLVGAGLRILTFATLGLVGCLTVLLWWAIPALCLHFTAQLFPQYLSVSSASAAIFAGLILMVASVLGNGLAGGNSNRSSN